MDNARDELEALYITHKQRLIAMAIKIGSPYSMAEDFVQDAFVSAMQHIESYRGDCSLYSWLCKITSNTVYMYFRKASSRNEIGAFHKENGTKSTTCNGTDLTDQFASAEYSYADNSDVLSDLITEQMINGLPPGYRAVFALHDMHDFQHHEIAVILGLHPGTPKSQLHKARIKLRSMWEHSNINYHQPRGNRWTGSKRKKKTK